jgi:hypothetical protein
VRVARAGLLIHEVPSYERPRLEGLSNLSAIRDGLRILRCSCTRAMATICRPTRRASRSGASRPGSRPTTMRSRAMWSYLRHHGGDFDLVHAHGQRMLPALLLTEGEARHVIFTPQYYASAQPHLRNLARAGVTASTIALLFGAERVLSASPRAKGSRCAATHRMPPCASFPTGSTPRRSPVRNRSGSSGG